MTTSFRDALTGHAQLTVGQPCYTLLATPRQSSSHTIRHKKVLQGRHEDSEAAAGRCGEHAASTRTSVGFCPHIFPNDMQYIGYDSVCPRTVYVIH